MIEELATRMRPDDVADFRRVIAEARVSDQILLNERAMGRMVGMVQWILRRVGEDGIRLTSSGYLPPAVVVAATAELDWGWPMSINRESHLRPLLELRSHLRDVGLLRVSKGVLHRTAQGRALTEAPRELWWQLARTIHHSRKPAVVDATKLLLLFIAVRTLTKEEDYYAAIAYGLSTLGWLHRSENEVSPGDAHALVLEKWRLLVRLDVFARDRHGDSGWTSTAAGAAFARAALQSAATGTAS
jgi:hypothetical protein